MLLGLSIVYANYIPITEEYQLVTKEMDDTSVGVNIMYDMVRTHYCSPIYPVKLQYMLSTDDTITNQ